MKELSVEEKAKRYDEALKAAIVASKDEDRRLKATLERIFPELKEGEDERTWIINYLSNRILNSTIIAEKENLKKAVAWLEKQGEQKSIDEIAKEVSKDKTSAVAFLKEAGIMNENGELAEQYRQGKQKHAEWHREDEQNLNACLGYIRDEFLRKWLTDIIHVKYDKPADKVKPKFKVGDTIQPKDPVLGEPRIIERIYPTWGYDTNKGILDFEFEDNWELVEQKPAWSEEDEKMIQDIINDIAIAQEQVYCKSRCEDEINWLKSLKDRVQPKQEWSEEDENEVDILKAYIHSGDWSDSHIDRALGIVDELVNKVKSLKERYTWKPSDEQMDAIKDALDYLGGNTKIVRKYLMSLYEDLKKLKG